MFSTKAITNMVQNTLNATIGSPANNGTFITTGEKVFFVSYGENIIVQRNDQHGELIKTIVVEAQANSFDAQKQARKILADLLE